KGSAQKTAFLNLGRIKDADVTYINGVKVGNVTYEYPPRWYDIPAGVLKDGKNMITVRVINGSGKGQFIADKPYYLEIGGQKIDLKGQWKYRNGAKMEKMAPGQTFIRWKPTGLYNSMINPLINYKVKGFLWYQGESNTGKPKEYGDLLTTMINDWRSKWQEKDAPFLIVQLANFMEAKNQPVESNWAELRDQQRKVSLNVPKSGLAVIIDVGEWNDIHPLDKKTVGDRLALQALKIADKEDIIADGPVYQSMKTDGNKIILSFKKGTDDFAPVSELKGFAIKGKTGNYQWAKAKIQGKNIIVWNDEIKDPVSVRYDWADNPDGNLKNKAGLPASSFTTE
ncbi:sialate O-acetylesterase, partial [Chryseobacterium taichungense]|uniref:sialate O-acetylesterase n=1 Tax=Chryseobacterium taichungense TaxID=295069 RepID=UPI0028B0D2BF